MRKPFQGVLNIIRFNWHFYVLALGLLLGILLGTLYLGGSYQTWLLGAALLVFTPVFISLAVSTYVYDLSGLYKFRWMDRLKAGPRSRIVNINAGFDETSMLLKERYKDSTLHVLDFYDPQKHTEVSIKRARKAYPPYPGTQAVKTTHLPFESGSIDTVFVIFSAHEVRDPAERAAFFTELTRMLKPGGQLVITEHLRDLPNFLAYNIGYFHFYPKSAWHHTFNSAGLKIVEEIKCTPFVSTFILGKNGDTL